MAPGDATDDILQAAVDALAAADRRRRPSGAVVWLAWVISHIHRLTGRAEHSREYLDEIVLGRVDRSPWTGPFDLVRGLAGVAVYALERLPVPRARRALESIVERLEERAERTADGYAWFVEPALLPPETRATFPDGAYDLGMSHGVGGVVAVLGAIHAEGISPTRSGGLLHGAVTSLLMRRLARVQRCGLAWFDGDLGLVPGLLRAARRASRPDWAEAAMGVALRAARSAAYPNDAGLAGGSAGTAHLFNHLYQASGNDAFAEAARRWYAHTLELRRPGLGIGGFAGMRTFRKSVTPSAPRVLDGATGVALALLAAISGQPPLWDRLMALSLGTIPILRSRIRRSTAAT